jgi:hypothetical protein
MPPSLGALSACRWGTRYSNKRHDIIQVNLKPIQGTGVERISHWPTFEDKRAPTLDLAVIKSLTQPSTRRAPWTKVAPPMLPICRPWRFSRTAARASTPPGDPPRAAWPASTPLTLSFPYLEAHQVSKRHSIPFAPRDSSKYAHYSPSGRCKSSRTDRKLWRYVLCGHRMDIWTSMIYWHFQCSRQHSEQ